MASSSRKLIFINFLLILLIGGMFWFMFTGGSTDFFKLYSLDNTPPAGVKQTSSSNSTVSTSGLSAKDRQEIETLQNQLEAEKQRAASSRAQLQARAQNPATQTTQSKAPAATGDSLAGLKVEQQTQLIAQMIQAQLKGAAAENQRLKQVLAQKDQEIATVKKRNSDFARKLVKLDNSAQVLLAKLVADGNTISSSDQDYLGAMQDLQNDTVSPGRSINLSETDLINRVEISDSDDAGSISAELRTAVDGLMEKNKKPKPAGNSKQAVTASTGQATNIDNLVSQLMSNKEEKKSQEQFQTDSQYLDSLDPMEKERQNETRWVTVRQGDTLFDIAQRVYNNGNLYRKLFEANPQVLTNPDSIKTGQRLRVPL